MMKNTHFYLFLFFTFLQFHIPAQGQTVGLLTYDQDSQNGYTLFNPFFSTSTYLVDNCGRLVNEWESTYTPAASTRLLENGNLLRTASNGVAANPVFAFGGGGERIQEVDWDGNLLWEFIYSDTAHRMHHDFSQLDNGNLLVPAWELKTKAEAIQAGRDTALIPDDVLWAEYIIEVVPMTGEIVWEWHLWDHLIQDFDGTKDNYGVIADHPELLDINRTGGPSANGGRNWLHINSIDYNEELDQIAVNSFFISEFFIIDHSTTTAEAAGNSGGNSTQGGDLLYRWGNPQNYDHGTEDDRTIFGAHNIHWIPEGLNDAGKIMFFNNGNGRPSGSFSSVDIITPPIDNASTGQYTYDTGFAFAPTGAEWSYSSDPVEDFYSSFLSGAQRLTNGNTLICSGANGRFFEINESKEIAWEYINPAINTGVITQGDTIPLLGTRKANIVFRCTRYAPDFVGLVNADLTPGDPIELEFTQPYDCEIISSIKELKNDQIQIYPNPAQDHLIIETLQTLNTEVSVFNSMGQLLDYQTLETRFLHLNVSEYPQGLYFIKIGNMEVKKIIVER